MSGEYANVRICGEYTNIWISVNMQIFEISKYANILTCQYALSMWIYEYLNMQIYEYSEWQHANVR